MSPILGSPSELLPRTCGGCFYDVSDGALAAHKTELRIALDQGLKRLTPRERVVVRRLWEFGQPQTTIAERMRLSEATVSATRKSAEQTFHDLGLPHPALIYHVLGLSDNTCAEAGLFDRDGNPVWLHESARPLRTLPA